MDRARWLRTDMDCENLTRSSLHLVVEALVVALSRLGLVRQTGCATKGRRRSTHLSLDGPLVMKKAIVRRASEPTIATSQEPERPSRPSAKHAPAAAKANAALAEDDQASLYVDRLVPVTHPDIGVEIDTRPWVSPPPRGICGLRHAVVSRSGMVQIIPPWPLSVLTTSC